MLPLKNNRLGGEVFREISLASIEELSDLLVSIFGSKGVVVSGRDLSPVSRMFKRALTAGLMSLGVEVLDFHDATSGEISFSIRKFGAIGGFNIVLDHAADKCVTIKLFKNPGYEIVGEELARYLSGVKRRERVFERVGWVSYVEYIHKLYAAALAGFIKQDVVQERHLKVVVDPTDSPASNVLSEFLQSIGANYVMVSGFNPSSLYPYMWEIERVALVSNATEAIFGVVFNNDATQIALYSPRLGLLMPEDIVLFLSKRFPTGSKIFLQEPFIRAYVDKLKSEGYDVRIYREENKMIEDIRRIRPAIVVSWRGEIALPAFSLSYDSLALFSILLEAVALGMHASIEEVEEVRSRSVSGVIAVEKVLSECRETRSVAIWGCRDVKSGKTFVYSPKERAFLIMEN